MRVGVTGATGFLGSHLARGLAERGFSVVAIVRSPDQARWVTHLGGEVRQADLRDRDSLAAAFAGLDALVSNAALASERVEGDPVAFAEADRAATVNVVEAALATGVTRLIHLSSVAVYRIRWPWQRIREDHPRRGPGGRWDLLRLVTRPGYADGKARSEEVVWAATARGLRPTVLRPGPVYGSRDTKLTASYGRAMEARLRVVPALGVPHVHAGDVAAAVAGALANEGSIGRAYNVTGDPVSLPRVVRTVREVRGHGPWIVAVPIPVRLTWNDEAARADLGVRYRPLTEGLREALDV